MLIRISPLLFIIFYIALGVGVSVFGPVEYKGYEYGLVIAYVASFLVLFSIGFGVGLSIPIEESTAVGDDRLIRRIFHVSLAVTALILLVELVRRASGEGLAIDISDVGNAYFQAYAGYERNTGDYSLSFILSTLVAAPAFIATVWGLFYFWRLSLLDKLLVVLLILATLVLYTVGQGKQKQFGDYAIFFVGILAIKIGARGRLRFRDVAIGSSIFVFAVLALSFLLGKRYDAIDVNYSTINARIHPLQSIRLDSSIFDIFGQKLGFSLAMLSQYLSSGYYGLSLGLQQDFTWTWFLGESYSVAVIFNRWFGFPFMFEQTYPVQIGYTTGWGASKWVSIFPWLASDWTYPGALVVLAIFAAIYARVWRESIEYRNPFAILIFCLLNIGVVYIPANNQLVHTPGAIITGIVAFGLYFAFGPRFNAAPRAG